MLNVTSARASLPQNLQVRNIDEEVEQEVERQMKEEESFHQQKKQSKEERLAYLNQLKSEKRDMIKKQKLAQKQLNEESDESGKY